MIEGVLIAESLREGATVDLSGLTLGTFTRIRPADAAPDQAQVWTLVAFTSTTADPQDLGARFAEALIGPGWYVDYYTEDSTYLVLPAEVITYRGGDAEGRSRAGERARTHGVPNSQLDWQE